MCLLFLIHAKRINHRQHPAVLPGALHMQPTTVTLQLLQQSQAGHNITALLTSCGAREMA